MKENRSATGGVARWMGSQEARRAGRQQATVRWSPIAKMVPEMAAVTRLHMVALSKDGGGVIRPVLSKDGACSRVARHRETPCVFKSSFTNFKQIQIAKETYRMHRTYI